MESLIPFIIMLILGSLFSGGKKRNEKKQQAKPFTAEKQERNESPIKKLKEMSRDLYKEIQQEFEVEQEKAQPKPAVTPPEPVRKTRQREVPVQETVPLESRRQRGALQSKVATMQKKPQIKEKNKQLMPTSSDDIMKGIIFAEIIGPPKSKR